MSSQAPNLSRSSTAHEADSHTLVYTASPWKLFWADVATFLHLAPHIFDIIMPAWEYSSLPSYDELYPKERGNLFALAMHGMLFFVQTLFLISVFVLAVIPMWPVTPVVVVGWIWAFTKLNKYLCYPLNGRPGTMQSDPSILAIQPQPLPPGSRRSPPHALNRQSEDMTEKWIFINGVAVGRHWLKSNISLLSLIFQRPITGVHNRSAGILFDVIEVLIERTFDYCTTDIRNAFEVLGSSLRDPKIRKVVLLLHSQGGIQGGLIVDWLLDQVTREDLGKLEIYTFGCAANHFNNPRVSASATSREPVREAISHVEHYANINDFVARWGILNAVHPLTGKRRGVLGMLESLVTFGWLRNKKSRTAGQEMRHSAEDEKVGYQGRIFELPRRGHMMNQHYLARMFPLEKQNGRWRVRETRDGDGSLMNMKLKFINQGGENREQREERRSVQQGEEVVRLSSEIYPFAPLLLEGQRGHRARGRRATRATQHTVADNHHVGSASGRNLAANSDNSETTERTPLVVHSLGIDTGSPASSQGLSEEERDWPEGNLRMKDLSRLWKYVNGGDPDEKLSPVQAKRGKTF